MKEGIVPVPPLPLLSSRAMNYLFRSYRIWGSRSGGGETLVSVEVL
jgi:hypothetical protein